MPLKRPAEFDLVCACCAWPLTELQRDRVCRAAAAMTNWKLFMRVVRRHRVGGLVHRALLAANVRMPAGEADGLAAMARGIALHNLAAAAESVRLQQMFDAAGIRAVFVKGVSLAQLAYGTISLKHGKDVDVLVRPDAATKALRFLEDSGYGLIRPARRLSEAQLWAVVNHKNQFELLHPARRVGVELHWWPNENRFVLAGLDANAPTQEVSVKAGGVVRTLRTADLYAYLCAHGAKHGWSRLKWLADLNALIAEVSDEGLEGLHRHAESRGTGLGSGQALVLCQDLLQRRLPPALEAALGASGRVRRLRSVAVRAMIGDDPAVELEDRPWDTVAIMLAPFLLGASWRFFIAQLRAVAVGYGDIAALPLPKSLQLAYLPLRPFLWLWRRWRYLFGDASWEDPSVSRRRVRR